MTQVTVEQAASRLGSLIDAAVNGEEVVLVHGNHSSVRLVSVPAVTTTPSGRPAEWLKGRWQLPESFFEPLPDNLLDLFTGSEHS